LGSVIVTMLTPVLSPRKFGLPHSLSYQCIGIVESVLSRGKAKYFN
jgi:hypothetical protein